MQEKNPIHRLVRLEPSSVFPGDSNSSGPVVVSRLTYT